MHAATTAMRRPVPTKRDAIPIHELAPEAVFYVPTQAGVLMTLLLVNGRPSIADGMATCVVLDVAAPPAQTRAKRGQLRNIALTEPVIEVIEVQRALYAVKP